MNFAAAPRHASHRYAAPHSATPRNAPHRSSTLRSATQRNATSFTTAIVPRSK